MTVEQSKVNLLDFDRAALETYFSTVGEKAFRAQQVLKWLHQHNVDDFAAMTNLSKPFRQWLQDHAEVRMPEVMLEQASADGTIKWLLRLDSGNSVETVFIPERDRGTLCVSTQVGCALECAFCSTARQGFNRNLTTAEIISQLRLAVRRLDKIARGDRAVTNVVLMGMGEPLLNFDNVVKAMNLMMDDLAYGLSKRRVTLSTAGVVPAIDRLRDVSDVSLAVSLHAPDDALRDQLVPINKKYPIAELLAACKRYLIGRPHRKITFEYVMLEGVTDSESQAWALSKLLRNVPAKINLIPFNPFPGSNYRSSSPEALQRFQDILLEAGYVTVVRRTRGDDIDAACGQLVGRVMDRSKRKLRHMSMMRGVA